MANIKKEKPKKKLYRFYQHYNNIHIVGETYNGLKIYFFETTAESLEEAYDKYKLKMMSLRENNAKEIEDYFNCLYGGKIMVEILNEKSIDTETLILTK
jgi:hypothetical protein